MPATSSDGTHAMMHGMAGSFYLGTSGFAYDEWRHGVFYPEDLKKDDMLDYYSSQLSSVEINYTFRRFPSEKTLTTWRDRARPGFVFTLKANQRITHSRRLKDCDDDVRDFLERARTLGDRLGCVLFQCPPNLQYDRALIEGFVGYLPPPGTGIRASRWSSGTPRGSRPGSCCWTRASPGAWPRPTRRTRRPRISRGPGRLLPPAQDRVHRRRARGVGGADRPGARGGADVFCYFKHEDLGASPRWRSVWKTSCAPKHEADVKFSGADG